LHRPIWIYNGSTFSAAAAGREVPRVLRGTGAFKVSHLGATALAFGDWTGKFNKDLIKLTAYMNVYAGTSGYAYKEWKGPFYPEDLPEKQMLHFYSERFRSVEINNTFYRMPKASVLAAWASEVPADFRFVLKASQRITHMQRLKDAGDSVSYLLNVAGTLEERLGPLLFQLPPFLKKDAERLREFLALLPRGCRAAFEFRHQSWFDEEIFGLLRDHQRALCIAEAENDLDIPFMSTADWGYLRLRKPDYGDAELKTWVARVREPAWQDVFVFFKHEDEGKAPLMAQRFLELTA
jgi:uncharacterized protein YecE (DUF72 family)